MADFQAFEQDELEKLHLGQNDPYREFLRREGFSMGLYVLASGSEDPQHPHMADEVYIVTSGAGTLRVMGEDQPVRTGSVVSVNKGMDHQFVDITDDLHVLVLFAPPDSPEG